MFGSFIVLVSRYVPLASVPTALLVALKLMSLGKVFANVSALIRPFAESLAGPPALAVIARSDRPAKTNARIVVPRKAWPYVALPNSNPLIFLSGNAAISSAPATRAYTNDAFQRRRRIRLRDERHADWKLAQVIEPGGASPRRDATTFPALTPRSSRQTRAACILSRRSPHPPIDSAEATYALLAEWPA
jgi:hypothetical protein